MNIVVFKGGRDVSWVVGLVLSSAPLCSGCSGAEYRVRCCPQREPVYTGRRAGDRGDRRRRRRRESLLRGIRTTEAENRAGTGLVCRAVVAGEVAIRDIRG